MGKIGSNLVFMGIRRQNLSDNIQIPSIYILMDEKLREAAAIAMDPAKSRNDTLPRKKEKLKRIGSKESYFI